MYFSTNIILLLSWDNMNFPLIYTQLIKKCLFRWSGWLYYSLISSVVLSILFSFNLRPGTTKVLTRAHLCVETSAQSQLCCICNVPEQDHKNSMDLCLKTEERMSKYFLLACPVAAWLQGDLLLKLQSCLSMILFTCPDSETALCNDMHILL